MARTRRALGIYKRSGRHYLSWYLPEHGTQQVALVPAGQSRATKDLTIANLLAAEIRDSGLTAAQITTIRRNGGRPAIPQTDVVELPTHLNKFVNEFESWNQDRASANQAKRNVVKIKSFLSDQGIADLATITPAAVSSHLTRQKAARLSPSTRAKTRAALSNFCRFLIIKGILRSNPARDVQGPKVKLPPPKYLNEDEHAQVIKLAKTQGIDVEISVALWTGMRQGEIAGLDWSAVDWKGKRIVLLATKTDRPRSVPLRAELTKILTGYAKEATGKARPTSGLVFHDGQGRPRKNYWWRHALDKIKAEIPAFKNLKGTGAGWHMFRHTFASRLAQAGVDLYKIGKWLGHTSTQTTARYAHLAPVHDDEIELA